MLSAAEATDAMLAESMNCMLLGSASDFLPSGGQSEFGFGLSEFGSTHADGIWIKLRVWRRTAADIVDNHPGLRAAVQSGQDGVCRRVLVAIGKDDFDADDVAYLLSEGGVFSSDDIRDLLTMGAPFEAIERIFAKGQAVSRETLQHLISLEAVNRTGFAYLRAILYRMGIRPTQEDVAQVYCLWETLGRFANDPAQYKELQDLTHDVILAAHFGSVTVTDDSYTPDRDRIAREVEDVCAMWA